MLTDAWTQLREISGLRAPPAKQAAVPLPLSLALPSSLSMFQQRWTPPLTPTSVSPTSQPSLADVQLAALHRLLQQPPSQPQHIVRPPQIPPPAWLSLDPCELRVPLPARSLRTRASLPTLFRPTLAQWDDRRASAWDAQPPPAQHPPPSPRSPGMLATPLGHAALFPARLGTHASMSSEPMRLERSEPLPLVQNGFAYESSPPRSASKKSSSGSSKPKKPDTASPSGSSKDLGDLSDNSKVEHLRNKSASKRPKMLRLTPAFSSAPAVEKAGSIAGTSSSGATPVHPRKALAMKASAPSADAPPGLQLDLACLPVPSILDKHNPASTSTLPELVRKKSGEPVKSSLKHYPASAYPSRADGMSPMMRAKSVPNTPTIAKAVHFGEELEQVKVFKHRQRPSAVSRDGSPEQTETETEEEREFYRFAHAHAPAAATSPQTEEQLILRLPNFPSSAKLSVDRDIFLERVFLADDLRSVKGTVQVRNLSFEKWVAVRFTLDKWATVNEVSAEYSETIKDGAADRFVFSIKLNELLNWPRGAGQHETKSMFVCLRYRTANLEMWDNNGGANYQLDFRKRPPQPVAPPQPLRSVPGLPSTRAARVTRDMMEDLKKELSKLSEDEEREREPPRRKSPPASPGVDKRPASPAIWSARYDFGESLKNPASGSRSTGAGRAAALDYFSSRPAAVPSPSPSPSPMPSHLQVKTLGFGGMMSPGLGENMGKHEPVNTSPSPTQSPSLLTPRSTNASRSPLAGSPIVSGEQTPQTPSPPRQQRDFTYDSVEYGSNLTSPISPSASPSILSPSASTTSLESETTAGVDARADDLRPSSVTSLEDLVARFCWNSNDIPQPAGLLDVPVDSGPSTPRMP